MQKDRWLTATPDDTWWIGVLTQGISRLSGVADFIVSNVLADIYPRRRSGGKTITSVMVTQDGSYGLQPEGLVILVLISVR
jgi:hypothetical protein